MSENLNRRQVLVASYYDSVRAHFAVNTLQNAGIEAFLQNEIMSDMMPFGDGGYLIRVFESDVVKAKYELNKLQEHVQIDTDEGEYLHSSSHIFKDNPYLLYLLVFLLIAILIVSYLFQGKVL